MTFEDFKEQFEGHIEGTAANEREMHDSEDEAEEMGKKSAGQAKSKTGTNMKGSSSHFQGDMDSVENDKRSQVSRKSGTHKSSKDNSRFATLNKTNENFKFEIPDSCKVTMMKKVLIEKMAGKYFLASHPYPKIEGEMVIFKPKKSD